MFVRALSLLLPLLSSVAAAATDAPALLARARRRRRRKLGRRDRGVGPRHDEGCRPQRFRRNARGSGLALLRDGAALTVFEVTKASPAQSAGLAAGDRIVRLAGEAVSARTLSQWRDRLSTDPAGTTIAVTCERGGKTHEATLVLADLIPATRAKAR